MCHPWPWKTKYERLMYDYDEKYMNVNSMEVLWSCLECNCVVIEGLFSIHTDEWWWKNVKGFFMPPLHPYTCTTPNTYHTPYILKHMPTKKKKNKKKKSIQQKTKTKYYNMHTYIPSNIHQEENKNRQHQIHSRFTIVVLSSWFLLLSFLCEFIFTKGNT